MMRLPADMSLWDWVKQRIAPLGTPQAGARPCPTPATTSTTLDLHGMTVQAAYEAARGFISKMHDAGVKEALLITGKSGQIRHEAIIWIDENPFVKAYELRSGGGAFLLKIW